MEKINEIIKKYIIIHTSASFNSKGIGTSRILFQGLPLSIAKTFLSSILNEGGLVIHGRIIPIILCDDNIDKWIKPANEWGGICGKDHVLNLRNSSKINEIIVILPEGSSLDKSNSTSLVPIGISENISEEQWIESDLIQLILSDSLIDSKINYHKYKKQIDYVLMNIKSGKSHQGDHKDQWDLINNISFNVQENSIEDLRSLLGLINEQDQNVFDYNRCDDIFSKIADLFENDGINKTVDEWLSKELNGDVHDAITNFRNHFNTVYDSISAFRSCPYYYYGRLSWNSPNKGWWKILTVDVWNEVLEEAEPLKGSCKIEIMNSLFRNNKPCPVVLDEVEFKLSHDKKFAVNSEILVLQKRRTYEVIDTIPISEEKSTVRCMASPPPHKSPLFYQFKIEEYRDSTQKVISLANYEPGFVFDIAQLEKVTALKEKIDKRTRNRQWTSTLVISNSGTHEIDFYWDKNRFEYIESNCIYTKSEQIKKALNPNLKTGTGGVTFEIENECFIEFLFSKKNDKTLNIIKISVSISDSEPIGVSNIHDKLILQNRFKGINEKVMVYPIWNLLHQIQKWITENPEQSHYPILMGTDFKDNFKQPDWNGSTLISESELNIDCRPPKLTHSPPKEILDIRQQIIKIIIDNNDTSADIQQPLIEYRELYHSDIKDVLSNLILQYINTYSEWFNSDPDNATWFDMIAICDIQDNVIENEPFAILLNPFHPIRLAWQFQSQLVLYESLQKNIPCPAAGILESSQFPDSMVLPCFRSQGHLSREVFISIDSNCHSWNLLWNSKKLGDLKLNRFTNLFNKEFGIQMQGLDGGLSSSQIERTLSDIFKIKSGQNAINTEVHSESSETELFNRGVSNWVESNLGEDRIIKNKKDVRDIWFSSGSRKLNIYDTRMIPFQPSSEELVDSTIESGYSLKWYSKGHAGKFDNLDLTILSHLANQSPTMINAQTSSVIFNGGICRERIRYSSLNHLNKLTFTESRCYFDLSLPNANNDIETKLIELIHKMENEVFVLNSGHLNSTPRLNFVNEKLQKSDYCAIASSVIDPSAFFDADGKNYLWDYDLPSYSSKHSAQSGFYLLARNSKSVITSVKNSLKTIPGMGKIGSEVISNLLKEISGRGIPTLKTLASGGTSASGEIGMLTAMNVLQNYDPADSSFQFFPINHNGSCNLLIPIDPFTSQLNALFDRLGLEKSRPDLLALSFRVKDGKIINIKITPIEVKYRNSPMNPQQLKTALFQCENFKLFYDKLLERSAESSLWDIARCKLFSDMISFSFATYGRKIKDLDETLSWAKLQSGLIDALNYHEKLMVNPDGRLIVISDYPLTEFDKVNSSVNNNVLKMSFKDAKDLLLGQNLDKFNALGALVGNWGLICDDDNINSQNKLVNKETLIITPNPLTESKINLPSSNLEIETKINDLEKLSLQENESEYDSKSLIDNAGIKFVVGSQEGAISSSQYLFHPSNTRLNQLNIGIVGDLGTGKTQLIKALIYNITKNPEHNQGHSPKFLIMDTKRDYDGSGDKESDQNFVESINAKIVKPYRLPINLFDIRNSKEDNPALSKAEFFIDILKKIFGGIGPNQEHNILTSVMASFEAKGYTPNQEDYSQFISPTLNDITEEYKDLIGPKIDAPYSLMFKLVLAGYFEPNGQDTIDFKEFFNQTVVLSLGGIASNDRNLKMVMIIFMNLYREYMLGITKSEYIKKEEYQLRNIDSYLLIDEANLIMEYELPVLEDILLKGREFGIGIILSSQYLSHFKKSGTNYIEPLLTWFIHKVPNISVRELLSLGLPNVDESLVQKIKSLECHYCLYKGLDASGVIIKGIPHYLLDSMAKLSQ